MKTPSQPWQISIKSRVAQTDLQMHSTIDGTDLFDGESMMPFIMGVGDMAIDPRIMTRVSTSVGVKVGYKGLSVSYSFPVGGDIYNNTLVLYNDEKDYELVARRHPGLLRDLCQSAGLIRFLGSELEWRHTLLLYR